MKRLNRYIALVLSLIIAVSFSACKSKNENGTTTTQIVAYYDKNGVEYKNPEDVKYYDQQGNEYNKLHGEDDLPYFVNVKTGESYFAMQCYISEDGYLFYDPDNTLTREKGSIDTYEDVSGKKYYDISTISWDNTGKLLH